MPGNEKPRERKNHPAVPQISGRDVPDRCPDCGNRTVHPATPEEIAWFCQKHQDEARAGY